MSVRQVQDVCAVDERLVHGDAPPEDPRGGRDVRLQLLLRHLGDGVRHRHGADDPEQHEEHADDSHPLPHALEEVPQGLEGRQGT